MTQAEIADALRVIMSVDCGVDARVVAWQRIYDNNTKQRKRIEELYALVGTIRGLLNITPIRNVPDIGVEEHSREIVGQVQAREAKLAQHNAALREALQALHDVQNGCPLSKYQSDWDKAMEMAERLLKEHP